jgi:FkbM family methyltransferase
MSPSDFAFVQIGAHAGREAMPHAERGERCLLVEPVPHLVARLREAYAAYPSVEIVQCIVADRAGELPFYYLDGTEGLPDWADQIGSVDRDHLVVLGRQCRFGDDFEGRIREMTIRSLTPDGLFREHGVGRVGTLLIDTEGLDAKLIGAVDLEGTEVRTIVFERKHTDGVRTTGYRYNEAVARLESLGYRVEHIDHQNDRATLADDWRERRAEARRAEPAFRAALEGRASAVVAPAAGGDAGVVYLAIGDAYRREALLSALSLRITNPRIPVTLFTDGDDPGSGGPGGGEPGGRDPLFRIERIDPAVSPFKLKIEAIRRSPYTRTVFLDTDTFVVGPLGELFATLDDHDFAIAPAPSFGFDDGELVFGSHTKPEVLNTGVIGVRAGAGTGAVLGEWAGAIRGQDDGSISPGLGCDQAHFNRSVKGSASFAALRVATLDPVRWNLRCYALGDAIANGLDQETAIIHSKAWEARRFAGIDLYDDIARRLGVDPGAAEGRATTRAAASVGPK